MRRESSPSIDHSKLKYHEPFKSIRADLAALMRQQRRDRPEMARLMFLHMRSCQRQMMNSLFSGFYSDQELGNGHKPTRQ